MRMEPRDRLLAPNRPHGSEREEDLSGWPEQPHRTAEGQALYLPLLTRSWLSMFGLPFARPDVLAGQVSRFELHEQGTGDELALSGPQVTPPRWENSFG